MRPSLLVDTASFVAARHPLLGASERPPRGGGSGPGGNPLNRIVLSSLDNPMRRIIVSPPEIDGFDGNGDATSIAPLVLGQQALLPWTLFQAPASGASSGDGPNTPFIRGVRRHAMDVCKLDAKRINPFAEAYAVPSKAMSEGSPRQVQAVTGATKAGMTLKKARGLAKRAMRFKYGEGRLLEALASHPLGRRRALRARPAQPLPRPHCGAYTRHHTENLWASLKERRAIATRYDAASFRGALHLAAAFDWLSKGP